MSSIVLTENIQEGMILAEPILNNYGQILIGAGVELKDRHKKVLKTWNIQSVLIHNHDFNDDDIQNDQNYAQLEGELLSRMTWIPELPIEQDLLKSAVMICATNLNNAK